jgi:hypothetical protein
MRDRAQSEGDEADAVRRWRRGHAVAARRQEELTFLEGNQPERAIAESLAALNALSEMGLWPGPRDPGSELEIDQVRRRWARIQRRAKHERQR